MINRIVGVATLAVATGRKAILGVYIQSICSRVHCVATGRHAIQCAVLRSRGVLRDSDRVCEAKKKTYVFQHCFGHARYKDTYRRVHGPPTETMLKHGRAKGTALTKARAAKRDGDSFDAAGPPVSLSDLYLV
ncbi:hypothetical protein EVAR_24792_1 [Eumeta japonica]|uniref:Uncharacterized protein n=1 Tax=Eumeta variegata TaxID=151549 RepID=A0A4C1W311_EUMVA|nr:hypothetical protein EVAR_24792_1 [Eumeta japonica]